MELSPGIYHGISWDDYRKIPYPSPSLLKHGLRSMLRLKRAIDGELQPKPETTAVGSAVHCMIAGEYEDRIVVMPAFENDSENVTTTGKTPKSPRATGYYKERVKEWEAGNQGKTILTEVQNNVALKVARNIKDNIDASELISRSAAEVTVIAEIEGVLTKTRLDGLIVDERKCWDLKTTDDIEPDAFYRRLKQLNYLFQFAWHNIAIANAGSDGFQIQSYDVIAAEIKGDFDVGVINIEPFHLLDTWGDKVREVLIQYRDSKASGKWPGLYQVPRLLQVPNWDMCDEVDWEETET